MAVVSWVSGVTGNWATGADWSSGSAPTESDNAVINAPGSYTLTINAAVAAVSLTLDAPGATVLDSGKLTLQTDLALMGGTVVLAGSGTISGGTISISSGALLLRGGALDGVTYDSAALNMSASSSSVTLTGGTAINDAAGTGPGVINVTGSSDTLTIDQASLTGVTINVTGPYYGEHQDLWGVPATARRTR
jgi:hypothetical protein